jgi:hypothetical protein
MRIPDTTPGCGNGSASSPRWIGEWGAEWFAALSVRGLKPHGYHRKVAPRRPNQTPNTDTRLSIGSGFQPSGIGWAWNLGRGPRLV